MRASPQQKSSRTSRRPPNVQRLNARSWLLMKRLIKSFMSYMGWRMRRGGLLRRKD